MKRLLFLILLLPLFLFADDMSSEGPNDPSTSTTLGGGVDWWITSWTYSSDNARCFTANMSNGSNSKYLVTTGYGFSVPVGATIDGIEVEIERSRNSFGSGNIKDRNIVLTKDGSTVASSDYAVGNNWPSSDAYRTYGGSSDLWGTTWSPAEINAGTFGVGIRARKTGGGNRRARVDHVRVTVYYTEALPVKLLYFTGAVNLNHITLSWTTANEVNNAKFEIEKSSDGYNYVPIKTIPGSGTTSEPTTYEMIDYNPYEGINYYRLKQIDYDGTYEYFNPIDISYSKNAASKFIVYPNPTSDDNINVLIKDQNTEEILIIVTDVLGREYYSKVIMLENGEYNLAIDPQEKLAPGTYNIIGSTNNELYNKKVIIK